MVQRGAFRRPRGRSGSQPCTTTWMALSASLGTCSHPRSPLHSMGRAMPVVSTTPAYLHWGAVLKSPWRWQVKSGGLRCVVGGWCLGRYSGAHSYLSCPPGLSGPSLEDGVGLFLSAFLLLGLFKTLGWAGEYEHHPGQTLRWQAFSTYSQKPDTHFSLLPLPHPIPSPSLSTAAYLSTSKESKKVTALHLSLLSHFIPFPQLRSQRREAAGIVGRTQTWN